MNRDYQIVKKDRQGLDPIKTPTALDIAWAAGIYEGEGSCVKSGVKGASFTVLITQKDPELLYRMRDMFGGGIRQYNVGKGKRFMCHHWTLCGDKARVFLASIYSYLTARRKAQIENTPAQTFVESVHDLIVRDLSMGASQIYLSLWERIREHDARQKVKALEHKRKREAAWYAVQSQDPAYMEAKRLAQQNRRKNQKEKLEAVSLQLVKIA